jgi:hypothetical protein
MTTSGTIDAAAQARRDDQQLTEMAQIAPGNTARARELLVNQTVSGGLLAAFEAAAGAVREAEKLQTFELQQQQKMTLQQEQAQQRKEKEQQEAWLDSMSAEYRQAYGQLMTTVDDADKQYDQMRERLKARGKTLDGDAKDIDGKAIHLSDSSRAYVNGAGVLVDSNGVPLKDKAASEGNALAQQRHGDVSTYERYRQNQDATANNNLSLQRIDTEQGQADKFKKDVSEGKVRDTDKVQEGTRDIKERLEKTKADFNARNDSKEAKVTAASLSDLDADPAASSPAQRVSFASTVDNESGIRAKALSAPYNAAAQGTGAAPDTPLPAQKPLPALPSPG